MRIIVYICCLIGFTCCQDFTEPSKREPSCLYNESSKLEYKTPSADYLDCTTACNVTSCVFKFGSDQFSFNVESVCVNNSNGLRSKLTTSEDDTPFLTIDSFLANFTEFEKPENDLSDVRSAQWAVIHTIHHDLENQRQFLLISVGKVLSSDTQDILAFKPTSSLSRKVDSDLCHSLCASSYSATHGENSSANLTLKSEEEAQDCDSVQLSQVKNVSVLVDQFNTCEGWGQHLYVMSYKLELESLGGIAVAFIVAVHVEQVAAGDTRIPLDSAIDLLFPYSGNAEEKRVIGSAVLLGMTDQNIGVVWVNSFAHYDATVDVGIIGARIGHLKQCEKQAVDDVLQFEAVLNQTSDHAVCHSFENAVKMGAMRRAYENRAQSEAKRQFSPYQVDIDCMATGCTDATCNIHLTPTNSNPSISPSDGSQDFRVEISIPVCHQHAIMYKVYNTTSVPTVNIAYTTDDGEGYDVIQEGMMTSLRSDKYTPIIVETASHKVYLSGAIFSRATGNGATTISNVFFVTEGCAWLSDKDHILHGEEEEEEDDECFRHASNSHALLLLSVPASLCSISAPISNDQCQNLAAELSNPTTGAGVGVFFLADQSSRTGRPALMSRSVGYKCSSNENCDGISCVYNIVNSKFDSARMTDVVSIENKAVVNYRFDHCSPNTSLVVTVENMIHGQVYLPYLKKSSRISAYESRVLKHNVHNVSVTSQTFRLTSPEDLKLTQDLASDQVNDSYSHIGISLLVGIGGSFDTYNLVLEPLLIFPRLSKSSSNDNRLLSIYFKFGTQNLIRQVDNLSFGVNSPCDSSTGTSVLCHKWKDAAVKFETPLGKYLTCEANEFCAGLQCLKHVSKGKRVLNVVNIEFATCLSHEVVLTEKTEDGTEAVYVLSKGSTIRSLDDAYLSDVLIFRECAVVVMKADKGSSSYFASVIPRTCPEAVDPKDLPACPTDLANILEEEEATVEKTNFSYVEEREESPGEQDGYQPEIQEASEGSSSTLMPLVVGFVLGLLMLSCLLLVSVVVCRRNGLRHPFSLDSNQHSMFSIQKYSSTLGILQEEDEDDLVTVFSSTRTHDNPREMHDINIL